MPKRYEEEINEILNKFDGDWPPPKERQRARQEPPRRPAASGAFFDSLGPSQLMFAGLVLIFLGIVLRYAARFSPELGFGGYATLIGALVLFAGYLLAVIRG